MWISEFSVKRPVTAGVVNAILVIIGLLAINNIPTREYPDIDPSQISVSTTYRGASAQIVERKITKILEDELAGISGIQKINSTSRDGGSSIRIEFNSIETLMMQQMTFAIRFKRQHRSFLENLTLLGF